MNFLKLTVLSISEIVEKLPNILNQLVDESLVHLKRLETMKSMAGNLRIIFFI